MARPVERLDYRWQMGEAEKAHAICFVGNMVVPKTIDRGAESPLFLAATINMLLLGTFAIQHSVMARRGFKRAWTQVEPQHVERST